MTAKEIIMLVLALLIILAAFVFIAASFLGYIDRGKRPKVPVRPALSLSYFEMVTLRRFIESEWINQPAGPTHDNLMSILDKLNVALSK